MHKCTNTTLDKLNLTVFSFNLLSVTLTFNLPEQMFQMTLLLLGDNNCAKLLFNPCIHVQVVARTNLDQSTMHTQHTHKHHSPQAGLTNMVSSKWGHCRNLKNKNKHGTNFIFLSFHLLYGFHIIFALFIRLLFILIVLNVSVFFFLQYSHFGVLGLVLLCTV